MDADPRSMYFKTGRPGGAGAHGINCAGARRKKNMKRTSPGYQGGFIRCTTGKYGVKCSNPRCVTWQGDGKKYTFKAGIQDCQPETADVPLRLLRARYRTKYVASTEWQQGTTGEKRYNRANSHLAKKIRPENLIAFDSAERPKNTVILPGHYAHRKLLRKNQK